VYGDRPETGSRSDDLTVRAMIDEAKHFSSTSDHEPFRVGVASRLRPLPSWKREADALYVQVAFSIVDLLSWRASVDVSCPVYAGVMVVASASMARKLTATIPELAVPDDVIRRVDADPAAGVEVACELIDAIRASGSFDGVHLIPVGRYAEMASRLERDARRR